MLEVQWKSSVTSKTALSKGKKQISQIIAAYRFCSSADIRIENQALISC